MLNSGLHAQLLQSWHVQADCDDAAWIVVDDVTSPLRELLAIDRRLALEFFAVRLKDLAEPTVDREELLYNASVLAHYAQVSTYSGVGLATPVSLTVVFDRFVVDSSLRRDAALMETAGAQCLLLAGFFEDQMRTRHNIHWYARLGAGFFRQAAVQEASPQKARLLDAIANGFEPWRQRHAQLSRELRDQPYLLSPPRPPTSP